MEIDSGTHERRRDGDFCLYRVSPPPNRRVMKGTHLSIGWGFDRY
jgi:hypothetical protein